MSEKGIELVATAVTLENVFSECQLSDILAGRRETRTSLLGGVEDQGSGMWESDVTEPSVGGISLRDVYVR